MSSSEISKCICITHHCHTTVSFQELFICLKELREQTQIAHWTVRGACFPSWHEMYEKHYEQLNGLLDEVVERCFMNKVSLQICHCQCHHQGCSIDEKQCCQKQCCELNASADMEYSHNSMKKLLSHIDTMLEHMNTMMASECSASLGDLITQGILILEKQAWFYRSSLVR